MNPLEELKKCLERKEVQDALLRLYAESQAECTRNGKCGMEIGMAREIDMTLALQYFMGEENVNADIDNSHTEDVVIFTTEKISIKHRTGAVGSSIKAKWTSADVSVKEAIEAMINAPDAYYPHLLITYFDNKKHKVVIVFITAEHNRQVIKTLKHEAFKVPAGNSRGVEYSPKAMSELMQLRYFMIERNDINLGGGTNPRERRRMLLKSWGY